VDQHQVAADFVADDGPGVTDSTGEPSPVGNPAREDAPFPLLLRPVAGRCFGPGVDPVGEFRHDMDREEFVRDPVPSEAVLLGELPFDRDELPEARAAFPAPSVLGLAMPLRKYATTDRMTDAPRTEPDAEAKRAGAHCDAGEVGDRRPANRPSGYLGRHADPIGFDGL
jgi:hypothetical protein